MPAVDRFLLAKGKFVLKYFLLRKAIRSKKWQRQTRPVAPTERQPHPGEIERSVLQRAVVLFRLVAAPCRNELYASEARTIR